MVAAVVKVGEDAKALATTPTALRKRSRRRHRNEHRHRLDGRAARVAQFDLATVARRT